MEQAARQAQFLQIAASMNADSNHHLLVRNFLACGIPSILPGLANLTAPPLSSPPAHFAAQGPLPALSDAPEPSPAIPELPPSEHPDLPEVAVAVPPSLKAHVANPRPIQAPTIPPVLLATETDAPAVEPPGDLRPVDPYLQYRWLAYHGPHTWASNFEILNFALFHIVFEILNFDFQN